MVFESADDMQKRRLANEIPCGYLITFRVTRSDQQSDAACAERGTRPAQRVNDAQRYRRQRPLAKALPKLL